MLGYTTLISAFTSSIFSTATGAVAAEYHVSTEVGLLGLSLYVLGFALGPTCEHENILLLILTTLMSAVFGFPQSFLSRPKRSWL